MLSGHSRVSVPELHGPSDYTVSSDGRRFVIKTVTGATRDPPDTGRRQLDGTLAAMT
jgi:hypothetical protein